MVKEQQEIIAAFTEMAPRYEQLMNNELNRFWGIDYPAFVGRLLLDFPSVESDVIIDIATGTSYIPIFLSRNRHAYKRIIGLDITFGMLSRGKKDLIREGIAHKVPQVCASALDMPLASETCDIAICCLATHHMDAGLLLKNIYHALKPGGKVFLADAGGTTAWKNALIKGSIKAAAFIYFLFQENLPRAKAEAGAIGNIHSIEEWKELLSTAGFKNI